MTATSQLHSPPEDVAVTSETKCDVVHGEIALICLDESDRRALIHLLDRLCEHEEVEVHSYSYLRGTPRLRAYGPGSPDHPNAMRARRIWRRAQKLIRELEGDQENA